MKINAYKFLFSSTLLLFLAACSTKKDNFATRNWQALNTKYNVVFNGNEAFDKGILNLKLQHNDNFWEILPVERQLPLPEKNNEGNEKKTVNPDFDLAESKAVKAVQKRSIYIDGTERNFQIDESYLLLGKARYFDNRFIPALEAFNYILYKYPTSSTIIEAKIWREKTNVRLDNDEIAIKNLTTLLKQIKDKNQIYADANAILAQAFIKIEQKDSAVFRLNKALNYTKSVEEKARYAFILGQLNNDLGNTDLAFANYQTVIDLKRKSPRNYVMQAHAMQANLFDAKKTDSVAFLKKFNDLINDRENRPFLDVLHHQIALYYDKNENTKQSKIHYKLSLKHKKTDNYLQASNYRNLASIFFYEAKYATAGQYYDSTLVKLNLKSKEFNAIKKKRENLDDVIKYEQIAAKNDSILNILSLSETDKIAYFEKYIFRLKEQNSKKGLMLLNTKNSNSHKLNEKNELQRISESQNTKRSMLPPTREQDLTRNNTIASDFYFYNTTAVAFGKTEFKKKWGDRELKNNWRLIEGNTNKNQDIFNQSLNNELKDPKNTPAFYIQKLPKKPSEIDDLIKDRNFAYYQLGTIYKEKFKEYYLAKDKLESLLTKNPEERLILPSLYNLYKIYEIIDAQKAEILKNEITSRYPDSRYAQIISGESNKNLMLLTPESAYKKLFETYSNGDYRTVLKDLELAVNQFSGEEIISKMELLKANTIGKVKGLSEFKKALNFVALTYPNSEEGKKIEKFLAKDIIAMEALQFNQNKPNSWKILYKIDLKNDTNSIDLLKKITQFSTDRNANKPNYSIDLYTIEENFVVLHGWKSEEEAIGIGTILKEYKDYKITETPIIINTDNYKIVQIKKNLLDYLSNPKKAATVSKNDIQVLAPETQKQMPINSAFPGNKKMKEKVNNQNILNPTDQAAPPMPFEQDNLINEKIK